jgi:mannose-6-phosphate isomerase-like protein (cupin superfamily)
MVLEINHVKSNFNYLARDTSEIRLLLHMRDASLAHCTLPPKATSIAQVHKYVDEIWYFIQGHGIVWRKDVQNDQEDEVEPGISLTIPVGTHFQFRNTGFEPLVFLIVTMPPWPDDVEAVSVEHQLESSKSIEDMIYLHICNKQITFLQLI